MSKRGSTTAATPASSSPMRYEAQPRSSCVTWRKIMGPTVSEHQLRHRGEGAERRGGQVGRFWGPIGPKTVPLNQAGRFDHAIGGQTVPLARRAAHPSLPYPAAVDVRPLTEAAGRSP